MKVLYNGTMLEGTSLEINTTRYVDHISKESLTLTEVVKGQGREVVNEIDIYIDELKLIANELGYEVVKK